MATQLLTEEDFVSLSDACAALQQVTSILRDVTRDQDLREFYTHVGACAIIVSSSSSQSGNPAGVDKNAFSSIFEQLGAVIKPDIRSCANQLGQKMTAGSKLRLFTRNWHLACQQEDSEEDQRIPFIRSWLDFDRMTSGDRREFVSTFSLCTRRTYNGLRSSHSQSTLGERESQEPTVQPWTHAARIAAQSVFKALAAANCSCDEAHDIVTRIRLGSNRKMNADTSVHSSSELQFNFFLSDAIDHLKWHEVRVYTSVRLSTEIVQSDIDPSRTTHLPVIKRSTTHDSRLKTPPRRVISLCKRLRYLPGVVVSHDLEVTRDGLVTLQLDEDNTPTIIDTTKSPMTLKTLLEDVSNLTSRYRSAKTARTLSILLSCAVHDLHDSSWIYSAWDSSNIILYNTTSTDIPFWPFIQMPLSRLAAEWSDYSDLGHDHFHVDGAHPDDNDEDDLNIHQCPILILLARTLMEIFFWTSFEDMAERCHVRLTEESESTNFSRFMEASLVLRRLRSDFPEYIQFFSIVSSCFDTANWEDEFGRKLDHKTLHERIYNKIVTQLDAELVHAFSAISISEHDERFRKPKVQLDLQPSPPRPKPTLPFSKFFDDEVLLEEHSVELAKRKNYSNWKSRFQQVYEKFITVPLGPTGLAPYGLRIAVLDTGIDLTHNDVKARKERIKRKHNWLSSAQANDVTDRDGHGTFTACLLLDYAPDAELCVAKIGEGGYPSEPKIIAKAIDYAVSKWNVDIISMSFGYPDQDIDGIEELEAAIETAKTNKVLLFAAASNSRGQRGLSYPASHSAVIEVHSTSTYGNPSQFTPKASKSLLDANLATVGEAVESAWPRSLSKAAGQTGQSPVEYKSGTSYATPIAAGIAAFILLYAWEHLPPSTACKLKNHRKMVQVLIKVSEKGMHPVHEDGYHFLDLGLESECIFGWKNRDFIKDTMKHWIESAKA